MTQQQTDQGKVLRPEMFREGDGALVLSVRSPAEAEPTPGALRAWQGVWRTKSTDRLPENTAP